MSEDIEIEIVKLNNEIRELNSKLNQTIQRRTHLLENWRDNNQQKLDV